MRVCLLWAALLAGAAASPAPISIPAYVRQLRQVQTALLAAQDTGTPPPAAVLPKGWDVATGTSDIYVSAEPLRKGLEAAAGARTPELRRQHWGEVSSRLDRWIAAAKACEAPPRQGVKPAIHSILSQREFRHVRGEDFSLIFQQAIFDMLRRLGMGEIHFGTALVIGLVILLLLAAFFWFLNHFRHSFEPEIAITAGSAAPSAQPWEVWLQEARAAADEGRLREAVRLAYWAAISSLEARGTWRADRARTPREYLKLLPQGNAARPALVTLTRTFERSWYGFRSPQPGEFQAMLRDLEQLGCR